MLPPTHTLQALIERSSSFVLTTHVNPDGDGLGSELALFYFLISIGKNATIFNHSETPENYRWLDPAGDIRVYDEQADATVVERADVIIVVDTNQSSRVRSLEPALLRSRACRVVIDHHLEAQDFADHYFIDTDATSTGEIVYKLLGELGVSSFSRESATALYTAIMTDTGSFRYPRTDPEIHRIAARLLECGADPSEVYSRVFESWTPGRMRLLGEVLDSMKTVYEGRLAYAVCTRVMFNATGTTEVETDNFTNYPMSVGCVRVGILVNEVDDGVKVSFRSKGSIPINELAKEFGGNGHRNAAGARIHGVRLESILPELVAAAEKYANYPQES
jgi:phosphoesterase RecJ-like protein